MAPQVVVELRHSTPVGGLVAGVVRWHRRGTPSSGGHEAGQLDADAGKVLGHADTWRVPR